MYLGLGEDVDDFVGERALRELDGDDMSAKAQ